MAIISISKQKQRVQVSDFELDNSVVFEYFNSLPTGERDEKLLRSIYIGVLALKEDRLASFLSKTSNELGTELESLKMIFEMKHELFYKSSAKGLIAEEEIAGFLNNYLEQHKIKDEVLLTGNLEGNIKKNKTGDIVCHVNGSEDLRIVIECKFDKSIRMGDISEKNIFTNRTDTAWSQLIEAEANRDGRVSMVVLDISSVDGVLLREVETLRYIPGIGFVVIIDSMKGDYSNLTIAYMLARDIAINSKPMDLDKNLLASILNRIIKDINEIFSIRQLVNSNIQTNKKILEQMEKSLLLMEFSQRFLMNFLSEGTLTKEQLLDFYYGDEVKSRYKLIEENIKEL